MLVTEELHLLLTDATGSPAPGAGYRAYAEVAALVIDLMLAGRVTVDSDADARVRIVSMEATGDGLLDAGLARLAPFDGERLGEIVMHPDLDPWDDVVAGLVAAGVLEHRRRGIFRITSAYASEVEATPESELRSRLAAVLHTNASPTLRDAVLLMLVQALGLAPRVFADERGDLDEESLKQRIDQAGAGVHVGDAVEDAVIAMMRVIMAAVILPSIINRLV